MRKARKRGFTLVELILAAAILAFAISGMLGLFSNCLFLNSTNRDMLVAESHAQYMLEAMKNADFSTLKSNIDGGTWNYTSAAAINATGLSALKNEVIVATTDASTNPFQVTVTVAWHDQFGRSRNLFYQTLIGQ